MPTYEYVCDSCGHDFEVFQRMSDEPVSVCPECGKLFPAAWELILEDRVFM